MELAREQRTVHNHQLDYFVAVARAGSISGAASALSVSQPAVSQQIAALESRMGAELFRRGARGVTLTPAGKLLLERAELVMGISRETLADIRRLSKDEQDVTIATVGVASHTFINEVAAVFMGRGSSRSVSFIQARGPFSSILVASGGADLCVACEGESLRRDRLEFQPLFRDKQVVAVPSSSELAQKDVLTPEDIAGFTVGLPPAGYSDPADQTRAALFRLGAREPDPQTDHQDNIFMQNVAFGTGMASLRLAHHGLARPGIAVVPLDGPDAIVGLAYRRDCTRATGEFIDDACKVFGVERGAVM